MTLLVSKSRPLRKGDKLTAISELTVYTKWGPGHLTTLIDLHGLLWEKFYSFICIRCSYLTGSMDHHSSLRGSCYFLHVDDVRTSQET
jgi:hypothetical protein